MLCQTEYIYNFILSIILKLRRSVHFLISLHIALPRPSQSHYTLYNHQCTRLPLPLLFLPFSGLLMAVRLLLMFSPHSGRVKMLVLIVRNVVILWLEKIGIFGVSNGILPDSGKELFHKTGARGIFSLCPFPVVIA